MIKSFKVTFLILFLCHLGISQELPPLKSFYPQTYGGGNQNWSISQDANRIIYVANNKGLLTYNGSRWKLYPTPNQSIMRSVLAVDNRVFSGQYRDFGYWSKNEFGSLVYTSLMKKFNLNPLEDEEFWGIEALGEWLMFQSLDRIYILNENTGRINIIDSETTLTEMILVDDTIVFQKIDQGIFSIENGKQKLITSDASLLSEVLVDAYKKQDVWYFVTQNSGVFKFKNDKVERENEGINDAIKDKSIYSAEHLVNGYYALGSISNGLLLLDEFNQPVHEFSQTNGLSNNTVLAVSEDTDGNIWLAMDNGISVINLNSEFSVYYDETGILGTVYAAINYQDVLFLGTNQGLFFKDENETFSLVPGTEGQVWSLNIIDDVLFCGHDRGTYVISEFFDARRISNIQGTWKIQPLYNKDDLIIQGNYNGLYILEKKGGDWQLRNKIDGFDTSARYFEFISERELVVSHEYKGIFYLQFDGDYRRVTNMRKDSLEESVNSSLTVFNNTVYYASERGIYSYNRKSGAFDLDSMLTKLTSYSPYVSGKLILTDNDEKLWYASQLGLSYLRPDNLTGDFIINSVPLPLNKRATKSGYENILQLSQNEYLLGTTEGYIIIDLNNSTKNSPVVVIDQVLNSILGEPSVQVDFNQQTSFKENSNSFVFSFNAAHYDVFSTPEFRYKLDGYLGEWSGWTSESSVTFDNLPHGDYSFVVQSKVGNEVSEVNARYTFSINKPWYLSMQAIFIYLLVLLLMGLVTHSIYRTYYKRQRNRLITAKEKELEFKEMETQQQIMQFRNENLQLDIENKNRELGLSTMNLIQKNELLHDIKNQLSNVSSMKEIKEVVKVINRKLNTSADWKVFEEAFNNADKDFLKNVKSKHPNLTSNDLRLCAYLRLNLSSKEIAPLLNISHKSVEVKRYRLRKKMNLSHNTNLTDYILQI